MIGDVVKDIYGVKSLKRIKIQLYSGEDTDTRLGGKDEPLSYRSIRDL